MDPTARVAASQEALRPMKFQHLALYRIVEAAAMGREILQLGFGSGHGSALLAQLAARVVAVEDKAIRVSVATARFAALRDKLDFVCSCGPELPFGDASFDLVYCLDLARWAESVEETLDELQRVLRPEGLLLISGSDLLETQLRALLGSRFAGLRLFEQSGYQSEAFVQLPRPEREPRKSMSDGERGTLRGLVAVAGPTLEVVEACSPAAIYTSAAEGQEPTPLAAAPNDGASNPLLENSLEKAQTTLFEKSVRAELWQQASALASDLLRELLRATATPTPNTETGTYDLLIPTYNSPEITARCLDSLIANTDHRHRMFIVDDASPDPRMDTLLSSYASRFQHVHYQRLTKNLGFPGAVNTGLAKTQYDVVLINSDTEFPPNWLARLERCLRSDTRIAAVSPLSNNATICSVPKLNEKNTLPTGMSVADMDHLVQKTSLHRYPRTPTVVGFCMLMTRQALNAVGPLDMVFGRGYGEEVDWCQRAWAKGFECALCDDVYVYHHGEVGFSHVAKRQELQQTNERRLAERWPNYHRQVETYCLTNPLRLQQQRLFRALGAQHTGRVRALHVVHSYDALGGTERFVAGLVSGLADRVQSTVYSPLGLPRTLDVLLRREPSGVERVQVNVHTFPLEYSFRGALVSLRSRNAERIFAEVVLGSGAEVVHFSHLANLGSLALPIVARALGTKVVIVLHDYFMLCPDWNLMNVEHRACGRSKAVPDATCLDCIQARFDVAPGAPSPSMPELLRERSAICRAALDAADVLVAPSNFVKEQFRRAWGDELADRVNVIPHGTDPVRTVDGYHPKSELRVAFLGSATPEKGRDIFFAAARALGESTVQLRVLGGLGSGSPAPPGNVDVHGSYKPSELPLLLREVDVAIIASTWHETYCYTVDEAYRSGVPVVATSVGAIHERVRHGETGLLIPPSDVDALVAAIRRLDGDRKLLAKLRRGVAALPLKTRQQSTEEYAALLAPRRTLDFHSELVRQGMLGNAHVAVPPQQQGLEAIASTAEAVSEPATSTIRGVTHKPAHRDKKGGKRRKSR